MSNRVEELESEVAELRAAVDGLTEELVETRERLSQLEAAREADAASAPEPEAGADGGVHAVVVDEESPEESEADGDSPSTPPTHEDVERAVSASDEVADEGSGETEAEESGSESDEIIVA